MKFADHTKLDRKSGEAEGSAVPRTLLGNVFRQSVPGFPAAGKVFEGDGLHRPSIKAAGERL
jgi:hypothetical protein